MSDAFIEFKHKDEYAAAYGEQWPSREEWASEEERIWASNFTIAVDGWGPEGWVFFMPGGQDGPDDQVGRIIVTRGEAKFPVRVVREGLTRNEWKLISNGEQEFGHEMDFDKFVRWVNRH
jgi:hypothetical protein